MPKREMCGKCFDGKVVRTQGIGSTYRSWLDDCDCVKAWRRQTAQGAVTEDRKARAAGE